MSTPELFQECLRRLEASQSTLIGTHLNPDGDALGSALALSHFLDSLGRPNEVLCNNAAPYNLEYLPGVARVKQAPERPAYDLGVVVDLDSMERLGRVREAFERCRDLIVIDHHVPHEAPGSLRLVDPSAPATAVIITRLLLMSGKELNADIATCLLTGIVTDTGSFRFRNTTPESLKLAADLLALGGDIVTIGEEVYGRKPVNSVRLLGRTISNGKLDETGRIAWALLSAQDFEETGSNEQHTEGLVNELLAIDTVQIASLIRQSSGGKVRASLRSRGTLDVAEVARKFGGGGHRNAAGCTFDTSLEEAERELVEAMRACLASS